MSGELYLILSMGMCQGLCFIAHGLGRFALKLRLKLIGRVKLLFSTPTAVLRRCSLQNSFRFVNVT